MNDENLMQLIILSQEGNKEARETLIQYYKLFIQRVAVGICKRKLTWENSDELSIALAAFDEAINAYNPVKGAGFLSFSRKIISQRLIDYFRSENRHLHLSTDGGWDEEQELSAIEITGSLKEYQRIIEQRDLTETMMEFDRCLADYGTSIDELATVCPKHRDTRETLVNVAGILCKDKNLLAYFRQNKRLPAGELSKLALVSRRVLENGRKYIIALTLIMSEKQFRQLRSFVELD